MRIPRGYLALAALAMTAVFAQAQTDYSKIQIKANKLADNLYTLDGAGGTIGVLTGPASKETPPALRVSRLCP